ncbi:glycerophosphodiester phosphodiesterase [Aquibacillus sp. 3ASR75-11]|uniref:Glycerophosphodiester phosphodiesterase n=1 Tax=Terrihalobacillus insolitus TaxID=2950438 RepID=A0A9X4AMI9_9BACI|nr:glycerophosphodiester phosphodiesterase [Terrihalobacillus insolitus]MDC3414471.1 glycerophosphodiester phosphodiesterase [Terrihalobacillus insolitus]MDC3425351.1 glycerophosphodiester phosphodiesterase [Terrihalobacillus insolitus]
MKTLIYAHRGASKRAPENTFPAFEIAYQMGADGIETDVQLTKDGVPVLIHDENVRRTTNGTGFVQDYTYEEIQKLDAGTWFSEKFEGAHIPSLAHFLNWVKDKSLKLNIELKNNIMEYKNLESIVYDMLVAHNVLDRTVLSSFNPESIQRMKKIDKAIPTAFLTSNKTRDMVSFVKELGATSVHIKYRLLTQKLVNQCQQNNLAIRVYTVNREAQLARCFKLQTDGIITDVPNLALKQRKLYSQTMN